MPDKCFVFLCGSLCKLSRISVILALYKHGVSLRAASCHNTASNRIVPACGEYPITSVCTNHDTAFIGNGGRSQHRLLSVDEWSRAITLTVAQKAKEERRIDTWSGILVAPLVTVCLDPPREQACEFVHTLLNRPSEDWTRDSFSPFPRIGRSVYAFLSARLLGHWLESAK
jgi:hypothetical protein